MLVQALRLGSTTCLLRHGAELLFVVCVAAGPCQLTAARLVINHTVQQVTGHEGQGDKPQVSTGPIARGCATAIHSGSGSCSMQGCQSCRCLCLMTL